MGTLHYSASGIEIEFDDRVLAHLQLAIGTKLRRGESFFLSWRDDVKVGDGRSSIWISTSIPLAFTFSSSAPENVNRRWLQVLVESADSARGMYLSDEPGAEGQQGKAEDNSEKP